ncbi:MAG TPA: hypothetical protein VJ793_23270 [Anaerolineae bacterium]|nr:hypothetical protein [Anaerolineae bacterium]
MRRLQSLLDAYLSLPNLRESAAFPGWSRRIVVKHADRQIRGRRFAEVPFEDALEVPSAMPDPSSMVDDWQVRQAVQDAVAMLPPSQRLATTLFYHHRLLRSLHCRRRAGAVRRPGCRHRVRRGARPPGLVAGGRSAALSLAPAAIQFARRSARPDGRAGTARASAVS